MEEKNKTKNTEEDPKITKMIRVYYRPNTFLYSDLSQNIINENDQLDKEKNEDGRERN